MDRSYSIPIFLLFHIISAAPQDKRTLALSKIIDVRYECVLSDCSFSIITNVSNLRQCQLACISNENCRTLTFDQSNAFCQLFQDIPSQYGQLVTAVGIITMLAIDNRQFTARMTTTTMTTKTTTTATTSTTSVNLPSVCSSYLTIDDSTRNVNSYTAIACDFSVFTVGITWVRFIGSGGTVIPTYPLSGFQCNTHAAGYYIGQMPSVGSITSGTVCFAYSGFPCFGSSVTIQVAHCGSYYVYGLAAIPSCNYRYCTV